MNVIRLLQEEQQIIARHLDSFLSSYNQLNDEQRLTSMMKIFDEFARYMTLKTDMLYPALSEHDSLDEVIRQGLEELNEIDELNVSILMIHVDEPRNECKRKMSRFLELFSKHIERDERQVFPEVPRVLDAATRTQLYEKMTRMALGFA